MAKLRALWRGILLCIMAVVALMDFAFWRDRSLHGRAVWMQRWSRLTLRAMGVRVCVAGQPPRDGLLVSNHMGYLDVLVLGSIASFVFVSKIEVKSWPLAGALTRRAGTIFLDRGSRVATASATEQMRERLEARVPVVMFPEGTSSEGTGLLPFHSSLFEAPVALGAAIHRACLRYAVPGDDRNLQTVRERVAYWGEMSFATHLPRLLELRRIEAFVQFSPESGQGGNRKTAAAQAEEAVRRMLQEPAPSFRKPGEL